MNLAEYAKYDGLGLAELVVKKEVSSHELALTALEVLRQGTQSSTLLSKPTMTALTDLTKRDWAMGRSAVCHSSSRMSSGMKRPERSNSAPICARA